jgi:hypothetical protein
VSFRLCSSDEYFDLFFAIRFPPALFCCDPREKDQYHRFVLCPGKISGGPGRTMILIIKIQFHIIPWGTDPVKKYAKIRKNTLMSLPGAGRQPEVRRGMDPSQRINNPALKAKLDP